MRKIPQKIKVHILKTIGKCFKICTKRFIVYKVQKIVLERRVLCDYVHWQR